MWYPGPGYEGRTEQNPVCSWILQSVEWQARSHLFLTYGKIAQVMTFKKNVSNQTLK